MSQQTSITLNKLNGLSQADAQQWFSQCCAAPAWFNAMSEARPYSSNAQLIQKAQTAWKVCNDDDYLVAFEAHPMIGDVDSLREKYAATKGMASNEQQGANEADEATLQALAAANHQYLKQHGFIFIICATGLSAQTMLEALQTRLNNATATEIKMAAAEQLKITLLRLEKGIKL